MNISYFSIYIFIFIQIINILFLIFDAYLILNNYGSITNYSIKRPFVCFIVVLFETGCPICLGVHFYYSS